MKRITEKMMVREQPAPPQQAHIQEKLMVAISSSTLFDLAASDEVYREKGVDAYARYQVERENDTLEPGDAFEFVKKLLAINEALGQGERVEVILLSRNTADTGLRVFKSIQSHQLPIHRAAFTGGTPPYKYMRPFGCQLFLSTNRQDVVDALKAGMAAASFLGGPTDQTQGELRIAFDGDAVLFSDEAERVYQQKGLDEFHRTEQAAADKPLTGGPLKPFLVALHSLQQEFVGAKCPIRTALVTARDAPAHERVIKTLRHWGIKLDESLFLGGLEKARFLEAYQADVFFDDQAEHCRLASRVVPTGHVVHGVKND